MQADELADWMLAEHEQIHALSGQLRSKVAAPPRGERAHWIDDLRIRFDDFVTLCQRHLKREEQDGYLSQVVDLRPTLAEAVEIIRHEHEELNQIFAEVQAAVHELGPADLLLLRDCCRRIESLLTWLERHEEHENHLVLYAFAEDLGAQD